MAKTQPEMVAGELQPFPQMTEYDAAFEAGVASVAIQQVPEGPPIAVLPPGYQVESLAHLLPAPTSKCGTGSFRDTGSFAHYVATHRTEGTSVYCDKDNAKITAILDGHSATVPGWGGHQAVLSLKKSEAWDAWRGMHRKKIAQASFVDFLEDRLLDVAEPDSAELLTTLTDLKGMKKVEWQNGISLQNGAVRLVYSETLDATSATKGELIVPERITLAIPIYYRSSPYKVPCRLRWALDDGRLFFTLVIDRIEDIEEAAFAEIVTDVEKLLQLPMLYGSFTS